MLMNNPLITFVVNFFVFPSVQVFADVANYPSRGRQGQRIQNSLDRKHCSTHPTGDTEQGRRMHLDRCFSCFDVLERGRVPSGVVWGGLALLTGASELGKIKFVLAMYDADRWGAMQHRTRRPICSSSSGIYVRSTVHCFSVICGLRPRTKRL